MPRLLKADLTALRAEARRHFHAARGSHDWDHTERVYNLSLQIAPPEGADLEVVLPAALLHDIGREQESRSRGAVCHATLGAEEAATVLRRFGYEEAQVQAIAHCVAAHRYRGQVQPQTVEARVIYDADKLDAVGAVGIGRAFLFAGEIGARLHDPAVDPEKTRSYTREDTAYREFLVKLRFIRNRMLTTTGRRLAEGRHAFMTEFFDRLNQEVAGTL